MGDDRLYGGDGQDNLTIDATDQAYGGAGNNIFSFAENSANATVFGDNGDATFTLNSLLSPGTIDDGGDTDTLLFNARNLTTWQVFSIADPAAEQGVTGGTQILGMDRLAYDGTNFGDKVTGGALDDTIFGGSGTDIFTGDNDDDDDDDDGQLSHGARNDIL